MYTRAENESEFTIEDSGEFVMSAHAERTLTEARKLFHPSLVLRGRAGRSCPGRNAGFFPRPAQHRQALHPTASLGCRNEEKAGERARRSVSPAYRFRSA